jgi:hypothetical protein
MNIQRDDAMRAQGASHAGKFSRTARPPFGCRGRIQGRAAAQPALHVGGDQPCRSLSATRPGRRGRKRVARTNARGRSRASQRRCARGAQHGGAMVGEELRPSLGSRRTALRSSRDNSYGRAGFSYLLQDAGKRQADRDDGAYQHQDRCVGISRRPDRAPDRPG